jgi:hypothetical protein
MRFWIITRIFIIGLILLFLYGLFVAWAISSGLYNRYHDFDTYPYYQPFDKKFAFSHLLNKIDEAIFAGIGILKANIITDTERNTELEHRKNSTNGNAYKGNLGSFNLENDEQIINFFYSYGLLRITYSNKDTIIIKRFKVKHIMNVSIREQENIAKKMIKSISKKIKI